MLATCICLNGSLLDQLYCTIVYLHNLFTCTFGRINMSVCQDFASQLAGASIFSKIDLVRGNHQIPVAAEDVSKTAVITPFGLFEFLRTPLMV